MARYLIVKVDDDSTGPDCTFVRVRRALHEFPEVSDMGVDGASPLTTAERSVVVEAFENGMRRAKAAQKAIEADKAVKDGMVKVLITPRLYLNIKLLEHELTSEDTQVFFSEDGKTALILSEKDDKTMMVKLSAEEYATAGGKMYWTSERLDSEPEKS